MTNFKKNIALMAFSAGQVSKEAGASTRYIGVGSVNVVAINPSKTELETLYGTTLESEPTYLGTSQVDGKSIDYARIDIILRTVPENNNGIEAVSRMGMFIRKQYRYSRDGAKIQVIDKYGRTAWATKEELNKHAIPTYSSGPANIDADYRPCYQGEEEITNFFRAFLNIPSPMVYKNQKWVPADHLEDCLARFDNIEKVFKGDFNEFITAWKLQQTNKVKVLYGIRTNSDGRQFQDFYTRMFLRNGVSDYSRLERDVIATKEAGGMPNHEFKVVPLQEYTVESTPLETSISGAENPFGDPEENPFFK